MSEFTVEIEVVVKADNRKHAWKIAENICSHYGGKVKSVSGEEEDVWEK